MKTTKSFHAMIAALSLTAASAGVQAATITNSTTTVNDFGGFDWASNGTAVVDGFNPNVPSDTFDLTYYAKATAILDPLGVAIFGLVGTPFEYTIRATLNETSSCLSGVPPGPCTNATFAVNSGAFQIWYDTTPDSNMVTGAGITDGILILAGTIAAQPGGGFNVLTGGLATLDATVTFTNLAFVNPELTGSTATTTLQFGSSQTGWAAPTSMPGAAGGTQPLPAGFLALQADANQNFIAAVPEPGTIALAGIALLGLGLARRGRKA